MSTTTAETTVENLILNMTQEIQVSAPLESTFAALLEQLGPGADTPDGKHLPMTFEAWPGGRWYRDLGDGNGHLWGHVQAIKRPTLVEICGPLFMSLAVVSNIQYRLSEHNGGTKIEFHHFAFGPIPDEFRKGIVKGWGHILDRLRVRAESKS